MVKSCRVKSIHWNCTTSKCGKSRSAPGWRRSLKRQSSSVQAPNGILPVEKGRMHRGTTEIQRFSRRKKYEDLTQKDGRLEILQKWKFVSPKIRICHWLIYVRRLLNIKLCEMVLASPFAWGYHSPPEAPKCESQQGESAHLFGRKIRAYSKPPATSYPCVFVFSAKIPAKTSRKYVCTTFIHVTV